MSNKLRPPKGKVKLPPSFPIQLHCETVPIIQMNVMGVHHNYVVYANDLQLASFLNQKSALAYINALKETGFRYFKEDAEGVRILEILYEAYQKISLTKLDRNDKEGIIIKGMVGDRKFF